MRNSLHLASDGLLKRGAKPTSGIATGGLLRTSPLPPDRPRGGGWFRRKRERRVEPQKPRQTFIAFSRASYRGRTEASARGSVIFQVAGAAVGRTIAEVSISSLQHTQASHTGALITEASGTAISTTFGLSDIDLIALIDIATE